MLKDTPVILPHGLSSVNTEPRARHRVGLVIGKSLQDSGEQRRAAHNGSDTPAKAGAAFLPFLRGKTVPSGPNPGRLPGGGVLIVINLPWLITSFKSTRNIFHTLISSLILPTTHEREQFVPFLEVERSLEPRLKGGDGPWWPR